MLRQANTVDFLWTRDYTQRPYMFALAVGSRTLHAYSSARIWSRESLVIADRFCCQVWAFGLCPGRGGAVASAPEAVQAERNANFGESECPGRQAIRRKDKYDDRQHCFTDSVSGLVVVLKAQCEDKGLGGAPDIEVDPAREMADPRYAQGRAPQHYGLISSA